MATTINTKKVIGRRQLQFASLNDILADVEKLAACKEVRPLGNWSAGQVVNHLATAMNGSIDGIDASVPAPVRLLLRMFLKNRLLTKPLSPGFNPRRRASTSIPQATTSLDECLPILRGAIRRLSLESTRAPHPALGTLTAEEWNLFHCRHAELHLSFLVPGA